MKLAPSFRDISDKELASYLLRASGEAEGDAVNPSPILELLGLRYLSVDFESELPDAVRSGGERPRALLSFPERVIATDRDLGEQRERFSTFHEIGHYVLPEHVESIVLCTDRDLSHSAHRIREREANAFAAELMFQGARFALDANSRPVSAATVKALRRKYQASFEATARRLVEKSIRPCMLIVFERVADGRRIDISQPPGWQVSYSIPSRSFALDYFRRVSGLLDGEDVTRMATLGRDIADSITKEERIPLRDGAEATFQAEYFTNQYRIFCLLRPTGTAS